MNDELIWRIGGEAGHGIKTIGACFARICTAAGYNVFDYAEYPSLIRGGHNTHQVVASTTPVHSGREQIDLLVALNDDTVARHLDELLPQGGLVWDKKNSRLDPNTWRKDIRLYDVPLSSLAQDFGGELVRNTVALGASAALFESDFPLVTEALRITFGTKNPKVLQQNALAAKAGYEFVIRSYPRHLPWKLLRHPARTDLYLTGNDSLAMGALRAGMTFYVAYPMTPTSALLHFFAAHENQFGIVVKHAEDEIAVINMAIGASFTGARAMLGTSGGGFSLMVEALGLAGITETPLVINLGQRPGPATGLPTWTEQGDLLFALHAAQGDFPRAIFAPGDNEECFYETVRAFNLAEKYQIPVFIITDMFLAESHVSTPAPDQTKAKMEPTEVFTGAQTKEPFKRYEFSSTGVSLRALPGTPGGLHVANSDEHDEVGYAEEDAHNRTAMMDKRMHKLVSLVQELPAPNVEGPAEAEVSILCWGSTKGPVRDALKLLAQKNVSANFLNISWIFPFPEEAVSAYVHAAKNLVLIENNYTAQFGQLVQLHTGKRIPYRLLKYSGRQFFPTEIARKILEIVKHAG